MDILRTHPMVIVGEVMQENPFYTPPDQLLPELESRRQQRAASRPGPRLRHEHHRGKPECGRAATLHQRRRGAVHVVGRVGRRPRAEDCGEPRAGPAGDAGTPTSSASPCAGRITRPRAKASLKGSSDTALREAIRAGVAPWLRNPARHRLPQVSAGPTESSDHADRHQCRTRRDRDGRRPR